MRTSNIAVLAATLILPCLAPSAWAALGSTPTLTDANTGARLKVAVRQPSPAWSVQDVTLATGTVVHEYVAAATGKVFAVSWQGPALPDLSQFMGDYLKRYQAAARTPVVPHRLVRLAAADIVISSAGRMRHFVGHAYLPAQLPTGFSAADIE